MELALRGLAHLLWPDGAGMAQPSAKLDRGVLQGPGQGARVSISGLARAGRLPQWARVPRRRPRPGTQPQLLLQHGRSPGGPYWQETINLLLCYYRLGLTDKAHTLLKGIEASFFMGPCPGGIAHNQRPDGTHHGSTDFTDTTSMFIRTVVEGLFGVQMNVPEDRVTVQPCFPRDWDHASIRAADIAYEYSWDGTAERLHIRTPKRLAYQVRLMARTARVDSVRLNGAEARFQWEPGIGRAWVVVLAPHSNDAQIEVNYAPGPLAALDLSPVAGLGQEYSFGVQNGKLVEVHDPQGLTNEVHSDGTRCTARLDGRPGWHTLFALAESGQARAWLPVDVELRPPLEIVDARLTVEGGRARCFCSLRNNTQRALHVSGQIGVAGSVQALEVDLPPLGGTKELALEILDPGQLTPGTNRITATFRGDYAGVVEASAVDWQLAATGSASLTRRPAWCNPWARTPTPSFWTWTWAKRSRSRTSSWSASVTRCWWGCSA